MCFEPEPAKANKTTARLADFAAGGTNDSCEFPCFSSEYTSQRLLGASLVASSSVEDSPGRSASSVSSERKSAMDSSVGWSNNSVWGNSVSSRSLICCYSSMALIESSPESMSGASAETVVPSTPEAMLVSFFNKASRE